VGIEKVKTGISVITGTVSFQVGIPIIEKLPSPDIQEQIALYVELG